MAIPSIIRDRGPVDLPPFTGVRVMMLPFRLDDLDTLPGMVASWRTVVARLRELSCVKTGVAYLTIDEALVKAGETHRRPGLHVDGVGPNGDIGSWGGGGGYAHSGMLTVASHVGCVGWRGLFPGWPGPNGDCEHVRAFCSVNPKVVFEAGRIYECNGTAVHESIPLPRDTRRQFCRLSLPSDAPWYEGYTRNPLGVEPTGPIHPARTGFMGFRSS